MDERQDKHEKSMVQKVCSLPADMQKVRDQVWASSKKQLDAVETLNKLHSEVQLADKHINQVGDRVGQLDTKAKDKAQLTAEIIRLSNALQEEREKLNTSQVLLADCRARLQEKQLQEERHVQEIGWLRTQLVQLQSQRTSQEPPSQPRTSFTAGIAPPTSQYADLAEASRNPNWLAELSRSQLYRR
jgi:DNA repair ATPase RecN